MKVVLINDQLNAGGAERVLVNIANMLYRHGVDVSVVLYLKPAALDQQINNNIKISYLNRNWRFSFLTMLKLKRIVASADIIHVHSRHNLRYFMVAKYMAGIKGMKIVFHEHVPGYDTIDKPTAWLLKQIDGYIGVQERLCTWVKEKKLVSSEKVFFLPNVVIKPINSDQGNFVEKRLLMVANFRRIKNQLFALTVLKALGPAYKLDFFGMVDEQLYYDEVVDFIERNGLNDRVSITSGVTNIYEVLPKYDFALHTATNETGPLVLLEYMNFGLPFITYNTGEVVDNLKSTMPQLVVDTFDTNDWMNRIKWMEDLHDHRHDLKQKMQSIIGANYSQEKYWERLQNVYKKTLAN